MGKNICLLSDEEETSIYIAHYDGGPLSHQYSRLYAVKDEPTCRYLTAMFYGHIPPPDRRTPPYNKSNDRIHLICEDHCVADHKLLDWRLKKLAQMYERLADTLDLEQLWPEPIKYIIQWDPVEENKINDSGIYSCKAAGGWVFCPDGYNFLHYLKILSPEGERILHHDHIDEAYGRTFENESTPIHEMIHVAFNNFGSFSYFIEESFCHVVGTMLGGGGEHKNDGYGDIKPDSFCDERFSLIGYPLVNYLCIDYGFDIQDLPSFFNILSRRKDESVEQLEDTDLIDALSETIGSDVSSVFEELAERYEN